MLSRHKKAALTETVDDLEIAIADYEMRGFRLDMIFPADSPREAIMSEPPAIAGGKQVRIQSSPRNHAESSDSLTWHTGRAGMEYRDLIPGRMGGRVIASHIRLTTGGDVPDYVHYHTVDFQLIYCLKGRIKVVYEDQGEPFWLETGDYVIQPPEIRHRVLECTAGAEVVEISMPAEHRTWVEHEIKLPNSHFNLNRDFNGQRFTRSVATKAQWKPFGENGQEIRLGGIHYSRNETAVVNVIRDQSAKNPMAKPAVLISSENKFTALLGQGERLVVEFASK
jgi:quercetin dioxygenase-like cupin family protein